MSYFHLGAQYRTGEFGIPITAGYTHTGFLSKNFSNNVQLGLIETKFGWHAGFFKYTKFLLWDVRYFNTRFETNISSIKIPKDVSIRVHGVEFSSSLVVIPKFKVTPIFGLGYHASNLGVGESEEEKNFEPISVNTSNFIWKIGVLFKLRPRFHILLDYKQSIPQKVEISGSGVFGTDIIFSDNERGVSQLSASLMLRLGGSYSVQNW